MAKAPKPIAGYEAPLFVEHGPIGHWVYRRGSGPAVVVLHELPGLTVKCRELADRFVDEGFTVFLPLLFGRPERREANLNTIKNIFTVCIRREILCFAANRSSPLLDWLRELCRHAHAARPGRGVGVVGMCLTGNFAISLVTEPDVVAPVICQPSLPLHGGDALAMTPDELEAAKSAATALGPGSMIGFRYEKDWICPEKRFRRIEREFGDAFDSTEIPGKDHATLTESLDAGALTKTIQFLTARLM